MKILLIDDDPDAVVLTTFLLEERGGFQVLSSPRGSVGAAELARDMRPDLVLTDLVMPEIDGLDLLRQLRSDPQTALIPVVFLTGKDDPGNRQELLRQGALGVIYKPLDPEIFIDQIQQLLQESHNRLW